MTDIFVTEISKSGFSTEKLEGDKVKKLYIPIGIRAKLSNGLAVCWNLQKTPVTDVYGKKVVDMTNGNELYTLRHSFSVSKVNDDGQTYTPVHTGKGSGSMTERMFRQKYPSFAADTITAMTGFAMLSGIDISKKPFWRLPPLARAKAAENAKADKLAAKEKKHADAAAKKEAKAAEKLAAETARAAAKLAEAKKWAEKRATKTEITSPVVAKVLQDVQLPDRLKAMVLKGLCTIEEAKAHVRANKA